jgi:phosphomethylpyrimidine synthase
LLEALQSGKKHSAVEQAAIHEHVDVDLLSKEVSAGRVVIPANKVHLSGCLKPKAIGRIVSTKINANLGTSAVHYSLDEEREKLKLAVRLGADAVMDLSTGGDLDETRRMFIAESPVPVGTVPMYEMIVDRNVEDLTIAQILSIIEKQASQGVDFFTIHAGILREHLPMAMKRICGIVSRGGSLLAKWMMHHGRQNPMYEHFDEICAIMKDYDVAFSLGDGLRPGAIGDATDEAQVSELRTLGELARRANEAGCQVMIEGPGHVPLDQIEYNMKLQNEICNGAPFYVLGPLVTDIGAGYDHITGAIGATLAAYHGASFLCYVTPTEHLGLPDVDAVRTGVITFKIAAHAADVARGLPGAKDRDNAMSKARANLDWEGMYKFALDGEYARSVRNKNECPGNDYCSMCGRNWCAIRINNELKEMFSKQTVSAEK